MAHNHAAHGGMCGLSSRYCGVSANTNSSTTIAAANANVIRPGSSILHHSRGCESMNSMPRSGYVNDALTTPGCRGPHELKQLPQQQQQQQSKQRDEGACCAIVEASMP